MTDQGFAVKVLIRLSSEQFEQIVNFSSEFVELPLNSTLVRHPVILFLCNVRSEIPTARTE